MSKFSKICRSVLEDSKEYSETQIHKLFMYYGNLTIPEEVALLVVDEILWLLKDGKWHNSREIMEKCSLSESEVRMAVSFLREFGFIGLNGNGEKAILRSLMLRFVNEIQCVESEEALKS